ncbi:LOW QUALITY PROTEIN: Hypothetical protein PHPALM_6156 [Phytophthora palmivora]|uniref:Uncharacterized protein n=1 Tax=Phytophthora palmivora TaxID=4796 RepID=A0A2P4YFL2_9STRA|nr:LOW QUALITY PROTEIN: Hypothetical protein PHPALM_6156 [Phytophthora palmivora]
MHIVFIHAKDTRYKLTVYFDIVIDTFTEDPNIINPGGSSNYATLDSDGEIEGGSVYDDDDDTGLNLTPTDLIFNPALIDATVLQYKQYLLDDIRLNGWTVPQVKTPFPYMDEPYKTRPDEWIRDDYRDINGGDHGLTAGVLNAASTALGAFLRIVTPQLLEKIAGECNDYFEENLGTRVEAQHTKQQARKQKRPDLQPQTPQQFKTNLQKTPEISGRSVHIYRTSNCEGEICSPLKISDEGVIPHGGFGNFMKRDQFDHVSRNLHFSRNTDARPTNDRA